MTTEAVRMFEVQPLIAAFVLIGGRGVCGAVVEVGGRASNDALGLRVPSS